MMDRNMSNGQAMDTDQLPDNVPPTAPAPPLSEFLLNIEDYTPTVSIFSPVTIVR
jgi:hypothetical protein